MPLVDELKKTFNDLQPKTAEVGRLGVFYFKPLTTFQAQQIQQEKDPFTQNARHFQVRAKDADGAPIVRPGEFEDFLKYSDADDVTEAVIKMQEADLTPEDIEGNSPTAAS